MILARLANWLGAEGQLRLGKQSRMGTVASSVVNPVVEALRQLGYQPRPQESADEAFDQAAQALGDPAIALKLPPLIPIGALGDVDYALCTSPTLRLGLARLTRFYSTLTARVTATLEEGPVAALVLHRKPVPYSRHWAEFALAMIGHRIRQVLGEPIAFDGSSVGHAAPVDRRPYERFFGAPLAFSHPLERLCFPGRYLEARLRTASVPVAELLERHLEAKVSSSEEDTLLAKVASSISDQLARGAVSVRQTAKSLAVSSRTLQRELQRRNTTWHGVLDGVRKVRAQALLARGDSITEVSVQLGFADASAFFRAFRRWTGTSPGTSRSNRP